MALTGVFGDVMNIRILLVLHLIRRFRDDLTKSRTAGLRKDKSSCLLHDSVRALRLPFAYLSFDLRRTITMVLPARGLGVLSSLGYRVGTLPYSYLL